MVILSLLSHLVILTICSKNCITYIYIIFLLDLLLKWKPIVNRANYDKMHLHYPEQDKFGLPFI